MLKTDYHLQVAILIGIHFSVWLFEGFFASGQPVLCRASFLVIYILHGRFMPVLRPVLATNRLHCEGEDLINPSTM